jgi:ribonuclease HI
MKQMGLWETEPLKPEPKSLTWQLFIDGASKNNPGPAGSGFVLKYGQDIICEQGFYLGIKTNNQAEYMALLIGIFFAQKYLKKTDHLIIISDSQLLVRQMNGVYKVKDAQLKQLKDIAVLWLQSFSYTIDHVLREANIQADAMANRGVDKKIPLVEELLQALRNHHVTI